MNEFIQALPVAWGIVSMLLAASRGEFLFWSWHSEPLNKPSWVPNDSTELQSIAILMSRLSCETSPFVAATRFPQGTIGKEQEECPAQGN